jgi:hypothetical protein
MLHWMQLAAGLFFFPQLQAIAATAGQQQSAAERLKTWQALV